MGKKGGGGNDGFKVVKSTANKKSNGKSKSTSDGATTTTPISYCNNGIKGSDCTWFECPLLHEHPKCPDFEACRVACEKRHRFLRRGPLQVCSAGKVCTLRETQCPYDHGDTVRCSDYNGCSALDCGKRHGPDKKLKFWLNLIHIGYFKDGESNDVEELKRQLRALTSQELRGAIIVNPSANPTPFRLRTSVDSSDVVIALISPKLNGQSADGDAHVNDTLFSCKLLPHTQKGGHTTKRLLVFTSYTPNFVDQGIEMGKLTPAVLDRASRCEDNPAKLWGGWANTTTFSADRVTSAIAATRYYDVAIEQHEGEDTVRVVGESTSQPDQPLRIVNVKISHTTDYTTSHSVISRSMPTAVSTLTDSEYFKLPSSGSRMEYALVLAGAVAGSLQEPVASKQQPMLTSHLNARLHPNNVQLTITYGGFEKLKSTIGKYVHRFASKIFNAICEKVIDPSQAVCLSQNVQPTEEQLRQLRAIAGTKADALYGEVAESLEKLGFATTDVARSVGCHVSERHILISESPKENVFKCTWPTRSFISCYNQFVILDAIDKDGPAAVARNALLATLPPLSQLLVQWTDNRDNATKTAFKVNLALRQCAAELVPNVKVPVKAIVVCPPKDGYMTSDGTITVYVPDATPPSCEKSPPVIITVPASCVRDKDGNPTHAFDTSMCAVGRTVMLMVSLKVLYKLANGMVVSDGVTLVPEVPLSLLPKWFGNNPLATDDDYDQMKPAQSICWED